MIKWLWNHIQTTAGRAQFNAVGATCIWGTWGFLMNVEHGTDIAVQVALAQGGLNFITNLVGTYILEYFYFNFSNNPMIQGTIAFLGTYCITLSAIFSVHLWVGTPELLRTIGPSISISMCLTIAYLIGLTKLESVKATQKIAK